MHFFYHFLPFLTTFCFFPLHVRPIPKWTPCTSQYTAIKTDFFVKTRQDNNKTLMYSIQHKNWFAKNKLLSKPSPQVKTADIHIQTKIEEAVYYFFFVCHSKKQPISSGFIEVVKCVFCALKNLFQTLLKRLFVKKCFGNNLKLGQRVATM